MPKIEKTDLAFLGEADAAKRRYAITKSGAEWLTQLTAMQYRVTRKKDTERAFGCARFGRVFADGPRATGLRYRINSAALKFERKRPV